MSRLGFRAQQKAFNDRLQAHNGKTTSQNIKSQLLNFKNERVSSVFLGLWGTASLYVSDHLTYIAPPGHGCSNNTVGGKVVPLHSLEGSDEIKTPIRIFYLHSEFLLYRLYSQYPVSIAIQDLLDVLSEKIYSLLHLCQVLWFHSYGRYASSLGADSLWVYNMCIC